MPAYDFEYDLAKNDGCEFVFNAAPVAILEDNGSVKGIRLIKTEIDADGRLAQVKGSEFEIPCDMVLKASGQLITAAPAFPLVVLQISWFQIVVTPTSINRQSVFCGHRCHGNNEFNALGNASARDVNNFVALALG